MKIKLSILLFLVTFGYLGLKAQERIDLYVSDTTLNDKGYEPNTLTKELWRSDGIWVRNSDDDGLDHQNPEYDALGTPVWVYVRVTNRGTVTSTGTEKLIVYWAKGGLNLGWKDPWTGNYKIDNIPMGGIIGEQLIPSLGNGSEVILKFTWPIPNPVDFTKVAGVNEGWLWHFCLLARIEATTDPMTYPETEDLYYNVRYNNNIAWKNVDVVDLVPSGGKKNGGAISVGKPYGKPRPIYLEFIAKKNEKEKTILENAEVAIELNPKLYQVWEQGGKRSQFLEENKEENKLVVKDNHAILNNLYFDTDEIGVLNLTFSLTTEDFSEKKEFTYDVIMKDAETNEVIGGETYHIKIPKAGL